MNGRPTRTTPWTYYRFFVAPNFHDFWIDGGCVRKGFNASVSAFQLADIFYHYYKKKRPSEISKWNEQKKFLRYLCEVEPHFTTVQSVAFVYKHLYATKGHYDVGSPMSLAGVLGDNGVEITTLSRSNPSLRESVKVRKRDGTEIFLVDALTAVVDRLWPRILPLEPND